MAKRVQMAAQAQLFQHPLEMVQQPALANLSPEQRQAATLALFQTTITGLDEPPGSAGPVVRDLR